MILVMAMLAAAASSPAQQFDLVCTKTVEGSGPPEAGNTRRYHLDLAAKRYCMDECTTAHDIEEVTAETITIYKPDPADRRSKDSHVIYRASGQYFQTSDTPSLGFFVVKKGQCEKAPFTGLPKSKF